jgi:hypothetical protein
MSELPAVGSSPPLALLSPVHASPLTSAATTTSAEPSRRRIPLPVLLLTLAIPHLRWTGGPSAFRMRAHNPNIYDTALLREHGDQGSNVHFWPRLCENVIAA